MALASNAFGLQTILGILLLGSLGYLWLLSRWLAPCGDRAADATLLGVYRRHLDEMRTTLHRLKHKDGGVGDNNPSSDVVGLPQEPGGTASQAELSALRMQLAATKAELQQAKLSRPPALFGSGDRLPRMHPTLDRLPLASDVQDWSKRPQKAPSFEELYQQLYATPFVESQNVIMTFPNPYNLQAHMDYPHSSLWLEGDKIMEQVFQVLGSDGVKFIVEAGSMHGGSAIRMAMELEKRGLSRVPILCIDPWTGDLNMWLNRVVWEHLGVRDGRATTYDQFVMNVRKAITDQRISPTHIVPFPVSSIIGARWLQATGFTPNLIYLDSAHEIDETYYELCLYYHILEPGGMLMGDDYGWLAVRLDVDRFVKDKGLKLNMFGVYYNWYVMKPK